MRKKLILSAVIMGIGLASFPGRGQNPAAPGNQPLSYDPPGSTDTRNKPIELPVRRIYTFEGSGVQVSSDFEGARLNELTQQNDTLFTAVIRPENAPINMSPWYAFKIWADSAQSVSIRLTYENGRHRYYPKISREGTHWQPLDSANFFPEGNAATLRLPVGPDTLWVAAQELVLLRHVQAWADSLDRLPFVRKQTAGYSAQQRPIVALSVGKDDSKHVLAVISRQHPPEVTGYLAMQAFVETIAGNSKLAQRFRRKFETIVLPMCNPDGVANGHWRHNTGGIDLNRDWLQFHQPETAVVQCYLTQQVKQQQAKVYFGLDFHSTWNDIYYVFDQKTTPYATSLAQQWLAGVERAIPGYKTNQSASGTESPISKNWFFTQFGADAVTYEVGDNTPRDDLRIKGQVAAREMMKLLLKQE